MRTETEIKQEMLAMQATLPGLADLSLKSPSGLSVLGVMMDLWARFVQGLETLMEQATVDVLAAAARSRIGTTRWYADQMKLFQYTDSLTILDGVPAYAVIDPAKRTVSQSNCVELAGGELLLKVATGPVGSLAPLTADQMTALRAYVAQVKYAGVRVSVVSLPPDVLRLSATVRLDPQVLRANGTALADPSKNVVEQAILTYVQQLPFDSILSWTRLTDAMQATPGVLDFVITASSVKLSGDADYTLFDRETTSRSGYLTLDTITLTYA